MLLWACRKYCCCTYDIIQYITYMKSLHSRSIQVELGKVEGFWSVLRLLQQVLAEFLNVEQEAYWLLIWKETNQLCHVNDDVNITDRVWTRGQGSRPEVEVGRVPPSCSRTSLALASHWLPFIFAWLWQRITLHLRRLKTPFVHYLFLKIHDNV